jgi:hypothetical protein
LQEQQQQEENKKKNKNKKKAAAGAAQATAAAAAIQQLESYQRSLIADITKQIMTSPKASGDEKIHSLYRYLAAYGVDIEAMRHNWMRMKSLEW